MMLDGGSSSQLIYRGNGDPVQGVNPFSGREINTLIGALAADITPPTAPTGLTVNPPGCSSTNSFEFSWSAAADPESGIRGYRYKVDPTGIITPSMNQDPLPPNVFSLGPSGFAPSAGSHTFYLYAENGVGLLSSTASQIGFCWTPPMGTCPDREIPPTCVPSTTCYPAAIANLRTLPSLTAEEWESAGQPVVDVLQPGGTFSIGFEYRTPSETKIQLLLGEPERKPSADAVFSTASLPPGDSDWRPFWSAPFAVTALQLAGSPRLRIVGEGSSAIEFRNVRIVSTGP
jgi:hypothetical protein